MSLHQAREAAAHQFWNLTRMEEQSRDLFSFGLVTDLVRDTGYALRALSRAPFFFAWSVLVLALGTCVNCSILNLVYSLLLKPMPFEKPNEVVVLRQGPGDSAIARAAIDHWREHSAGVFSDLAVLKNWQVDLDTQFDLIFPDNAERLRAGLVTPNFFSMLGMATVVGRAFSTGDELNGREDLAVLSYDLWQRDFGGDPGVVGRSVTFIADKGKRRGPRAYTVVGVLPASFRFTYPLETEIWAMYSVENLREGVRELARV